MKKNYIFYADFIRTAAIISVIVFHSGFLIDRFGTIPNSWWWIANIITIATLWAVPAFFMQSGQFLLDPNKNESLGIFLRKRFVKILIPFIFWMLIYMYYNHLVYSSSFTLKSIFNTFISGPTDYLPPTLGHFWFIYALFGLYLATPVLKILVKYATNNIILYYLIIWFTLTVVVNILSFYKITWMFYPGLFSGFLGYFVLGQYLTNIKINNKWMFIIIAVFVTDLIGTSFAVYFYTQHGLYGARNLLDPNIIILSITAYLIVRQISLNEKIYKNYILQNIIKNIAQSMLGIFLVHMIILDIINNKFSLDALFIHPLVGIPLVAFLCFLMSLTVVKILKKIPVVSLIV